MNKFFRNRPLHQFTIILISVIIIPSILFLIFFGQSMQDNLELSAIEDNRSSSALISNNIDQIIKSNDYIIKGIVYSIDHHSPTDGSLDEQLEHLIHDAEFINRIDIISLEGNLIYSTDKESQLGINRSGEDFYKSIIIEGNSSHWSAPYIAPLDDSLSVTVAHIGEGEIVVGYIDISTLAIIERYITTERDQNNDILVTDEHGIFIISKDPIQVIRRYRFSQIDYLIEELEKGNDTSIIDNDGVKALATISKTSNNWYVVSYEDVSSINAMALSIRNDFSIFIVLIILLITIIIYYAIHVLRGYFDKVINNMRMVTAGNLETEIDLDSISEINKIAGSFNQMTKSLSSSRNELIVKSETDDLTGLKTRKYVHEYLERFTNKYDNNFNVFYLDIKRFASINESYGISVADKCLIEVSNRLKTFDKALVSRAESDEFVLVFDQVFTRTDCTKIIKKLALMFSRPVVIDGVKILVQVRVGISRFPVEEQDISHLITSSNVALKYAKDNSQDYAFYETEMGRGYQREVELELSLSKAFRNNEFFAELQPIYNIEKEEIERFELLARWEHQGIGLISPDDFIPLLERTGTVHKLDLLMLEFALQHHLTLDRLFDRKYVMCVNLSVNHIKRKDFVDQIEYLVNRYKVNPEYIELEVTESVFIEDYEHVNVKMNQLIDLGFKFSQDDFGDGYSSLSYLSTLNLSTLKISKSFLGNLAGNSNKIIVNAIVDLATDLGITIIVEGVEDKETLDFFKGSNCKLIQGYYFYKPTRFENIISILKGDD